MSATSWTPLVYPQLPRSIHRDSYKSRRHRGKIEVLDPYVTLERDGEETKAWIADQTTLSDEYLSQHGDRELIEERVRLNSNYPSV